MEEACLSGVHDYGMKLMAAGELKGARHVRGASGELHSNYVTAAS
jgi:hypothetical protein